MKGMNIEVEDAEVAYGIRDQERFLSRAELPREYAYPFGLNTPRGVQWAEKWFFSGLKQEELDSWVRRSEAPDRDLAIRFLVSLMAHRGVKHERKMGSIGYYLDLWFELPEAPR